MTIESDDGYQSKEYKRCDGLHVQVNTYSSAICDYAYHCVNTCGPDLLLVDVISVEKERVLSNSELLDS